MAQGGTNPQGVLPPHAPGVPCWGRTRSSDRNVLAHAPPGDWVSQARDGISRGLAPPGRLEATLPRLRGRGSRKVLMPGAPPPSEPRAFPEAWDCLLSVHSIIHQSHACKFAAGLAARKKPLACFALQSGAFGSLLCALRSLALLARACAGPHRHALAVRRGRAGVQRCVAASKCCAAHAAKLGNVVQMWLVWCLACTYDG